ncbi:MAG: DUF4838 domain-containing protein [Kiritimatiellae bacterium]|nr:DUF4838 domain-containing protein [Kiritimatiellia bacterium]
MERAHTTTSQFLRSAAAAALLAAAAMEPAHGAMLERSAWTAHDASGSTLPTLTDNDRATGALLQSTQSTLRCIADLGSLTTVHRLFFTSAAADLDPNSSTAPIEMPRSVTARIYITDDLAHPGPIHASLDIGQVTGRELRVTANLRFPPKAGRFAIVELSRGELPNAWNLGEIEIYGWPGNALQDKRDAVVLPANAPQPLQLAAQELSYYLGEIAGHPIPILPSEHAAAYTGTLFRIADLKPLAQNYGQMTNNLALGALPTTPVNVERVGREIVFRAWPYKHVLWSVWEFLDRQGVKWLYPDAHGDFVPTGRGIDLSIAPFQYTPSSDFIYANFGVEYLRNDPDAFLHFWRNRWTDTWGGHQRDALGGEEVPKRPYPHLPIDPAYAEGFAGYPHNFNNAMPERILQEHPEWCGILTNARWASWVGEQNLNRRALPSQNQSTFDLSNSDARQFIINKAIGYWNEHAKYQGNILWMLPEDSTLFSEDEASVALRQPLAEDLEPYAMPYLYNVSGDYFDFIRAIANGIETALPEAKVGAMAYSNTHRPPTHATPLPQNVLLDICMYGARNLPISSPKNAEMERRMRTWQTLATERRNYDYDLIHSEYGPLRMPVPLVGAMESRARFYHELDMLRGGTQADLDTLPYNPWNYYAYPRFRWNIEITEAQVLADFFPGYFREAASQMRNYYDTLERYLIANDVSLQARGYDYGMRVGAYPLGLLKRLHTLLSDAERHAQYWVTRERLQHIREGLDWILFQRGLTYADLNQPAAFMRVGPDQSAAIDPRFAAIQTAGQDVGDAWLLFSWAQVGDYVFVEQPGRYRVTIRAGIGYPDAEPGYRQMLVHIGGIQYGPFEIDHESMDSYTLLVEIPSGITEIAVEDLYNRGPFKVSSIAIAPDTPGPQIASRTSGDIRLFDFASQGFAVDSDWDGMSDLVESIAGTDEFDPDSLFIAHQIRPTPAGPQILWSSVEGRRYSLYRTHSLKENFSLIAANLSATPPVNSYTDLASAGASAFYQISVQ